jgi:hypothetical protein
MFHGQVVVIYWIYPIGAFLSNLWQRLVNPSSRRGASLSCTALSTAGVDKIDSPSGAAIYDLFITLRAAIACNWRSLPTTAEGALAPVPDR